MKNKIIGIFLVITMIMSSSVSAFAQTDADQLLEDSGFIIEEVETIDLSDIDNAHIVELPQAATRRAAELAESEEADKDTIDVDELNSININDEGHEALSSSNTSNTRDRAAAATYVSYSFSGTITTVGGSWSLYPIWLSSGEILQAQVQIPQNLSLDYDVYLYQFDLSTGDLMPSAVDYCGYATDSNFMPESVGITNTSSGDAAYAIIVASRTGASATDSFTVDLVLGYAGSFDSFEANESAFSSIEMPDLNNGQYTVTIPGNLNSPIDNDWFVLYIPNTAYGEIALSDVPNAAIVESYVVENGRKMVKTSSSKSQLPVRQGYNYFRIVTNGGAAFNPVSYSIKFAPVLQATKAVSYVLVNGHCQRYTSLFSDGKKRGIILAGSQVEHRVLYLTANNNPAPMSDTITITIQNPYWPASNPGQNLISNSVSVSNSTIGRVIVEAGSQMRYPNPDYVYIGPTPQRVSKKRAS